MKRLLAISTALIVVTLSGAALATDKTVTLGVPGMTCSACPITVKHALLRVNGVEKVAVAYAPKEAMVTFVDGKTNIQALTKATADAGYPSSVKH
ncbi:MAG: mercury resistance system periplasmic binding protein MerP [Casimicrobiaceae bacterium]